MGMPVTTVLPDCVKFGGKAHHYRWCYSLGLGRGLCTGREEPEQSKLACPHFLSALHIAVKSSLDFPEIMPCMPNDPSSLKVTFVKCSTETSVHLYPCPSHLLIPSSLLPGPLRCEQAAATYSRCHGACDYHTLPAVMNYCSQTMNPNMLSPLPSPLTSLFMWYLVTAM